MARRKNKYRETTADETTTETSPEATQADETETAQAAPADETSSAEPDAADTPAEDAEKTEEISSAGPVDTVGEARTMHALPEEWDDATVEAWLDKTPDDQPVRTADDVLVYDPQRQARALGDWTTAELLACLKGELHGLPSKTQGEAIAEYRRREAVEPAWTQQQVLDYYRKEIVPEKASTGVWKVDVTREQRPISQWLDGELIAWAQGEVATPRNVSEVKLAAELKQRFELPDNLTDVEDIRRAYRDREAAAQATPPPAELASSTSESLPKGLTDMNVSYIDNTLSRYADAVAPGKMISDQTGGHAQRALDSLFGYVMRLEGVAFKEGMDRIKQAVIKHRDGVFSPSSAYRFVHLLKGDHKHQRAHVNLIELFMIVTDGNKAKRKQVDIHHMVASYPPEKAELLVDYFQNHA